MVQLLLSRRSRKPMPSFAFVLTSGCHAFKLPPTTMHFDSYAAPKMLPTPEDHLMNTIDLRDNLEDPLVDAFDEDADTQTIFEVESFATFDHGTEQTSNNSIKTLLLLLHKFVPYKWNLYNKPLVALKPSVK